MPDNYGMELLDPMDYPTDLNVLLEWLLNHDLHAVMREHHMYTEGMNLSFPVIARVAGTDQIIVSSSQGEISVIRGYASFGKFEIYCLKGDLFKDVERYDDAISCGERISELLKVRSRTMS